MPALLISTSAPGSCENTARIARLVRHVAADGLRAGLGGDGLRLFVFLFIEKGDPVAAGAERAHGRGPDAARAAGDDDSFHDAPS